MKTEIKPPQSPAAYNGRYEDCQAALDVSLIMLMREARRIGWIEGEVAVALQSLLQSHLEWILAAGETDAAVSAKRAMQEREKVVRRHEIPPLVSQEVNPKP